MHVHFPLSKKAHSGDGIRPFEGIQSNGIQPAVHSGPFRLRTHQSNRPVLINGKSLSMPPNVPSRDP